MFFWYFNVYKCYLYLQVNLTVKSGLAMDVDPEFIF
jgi:hypothetical protein